MPFDNALRHQRRVLFADDKGRIPLQVLFFFVCILFVYVICVLAVITGYLISHRRKQSHTKLHEYKIISVLKSKCFFLGDGCCLVFLFFVSVRRKKETSTESEFGFVLFCSFYPHVSCFIFQLPVFVCLHFLSSPVFQLSMSPCVFDSVFFLDFPRPALLDFGLIARFLFFYLPASVCKVNCKCNQ